MTTKWLEPYIWLRRANEIEQRFTVISVRLAQDGQIIANELRKWGAFYQRLIGERAAAHRATSPELRTAPDTSFAVRLDASRTLDLPTVEAILRKLLRRADAWFDRITAEQDQWAPSAIRPVGWFSASPEWCFTDLAGTIPCGDGDPVALWKSRTGNALNNLSQSFLANRPIYRSSGWGPASAAVEFIPASSTFFVNTGPLASLPNSDAPISQLWTADIRNRGVIQVMAEWIDLPGIEHVDNSFIQATTGLMGVAASLDNTALGTVNVTDAHHRLGIFYDQTGVETFVDDDADLMSPILLTPAGMNRMTIGVSWTGAGLLDGFVKEVVIAPNKRPGEWPSYLQYSRAAYG